MRCLPPLAARSRSGGRRRRHRRRIVATHHAPRALVATFTCAMPSARYTSPPSKARSAMIHHELKGQLDAHGPRASTRRVIDVPVATPSGPRCEWYAAAVPRGVGRRQMYARRRPREGRPLGRMARVAGVRMRRRLRSAVKPIPTTDFGVRGWRTEGLLLFARAPPSRALARRRAAAGKRPAAQRGARTLSDSRATLIK